MEWENVREKVRGYDDHYYVTDVNRILMLLHEARSWNIQDGRFEPQEVRAEEAPRQIRPQRMKKIKTKLTYSASWVLARPT